MNDFTHDECVEEQLEAQRRDDERRAMDADLADEPHDRTSEMEWDAAYRREDGSIDIAKLHAADRQHAAHWRNRLATSPTAPAAVIGQMALMAFAGGMVVVDAIAKGVAR